MNGMTASNFTMAALVQSNQPPISEKRRLSSNNLSIRVPDWKRGQSTATTTTTATATAPATSDALEIEEFKYPAPSPPASPLSSSSIKPYLRKLSFHNTSSTVAVDLSKPLAENTSIAGLAFYNDDLHSHASQPNSPAFPPSSARHMRSTSNGSNFSVPTAPPYRFMHTPRPYTPPIAHSVTNQSSDEEETQAIDDEYRSTRFHQRANSTVSANQPAMVQIHQLARSPSNFFDANGNNNDILASTYSSTSLAHLVNHSQTSLSTSTRPRGNTLHSLDQSAASTRTSFDRARSLFSRASISGSVGGTGSGILTTAGTTPPEDEASQRAATIHAARLAYAKRQSRKDKKVEAREKDRQEKAVARENKRAKNSFHSTRHSRTGGSLGSVSATHLTDINGNSLQGKEGNKEQNTVVGKAYDDTDIGAAGLPAMGPIRSIGGAPPLVTVISNGGSRKSGLGDRSKPKRNNHNINSNTGGSSIRKTWVRFLAWFRTRLLRARR